MKTMIRMKKLLKNLLTCLIIINIISCNKYIDTIKSTDNLPVSQGYLNLYSDSNVLIYNNNMGLTSDNEIIYPKKFKVKLPKGLLFYEYIGSEDFIFYYKKKQTVFIKIDLINTINKPDSVYYPTNSEMSDFIQSKLTLGSQKWDIKNISIIPLRKNLFIKKGAATILLYNIEEKNYNFFVNYINEFKFL